VERVYAVVAVCAALATLGLLIFLGVALWPYLPEIAAVLYIVLVITGAAFSYEVITHAIHRKRMRDHQLEEYAARIARAWLMSQVIEAADSAAYVQDNEHLYHLSAFKEQAKVFPVNPQEVTADLAFEVKEMAGRGVSEKEIAGQKQISVYQVRRLLGKPRSMKKEQEKET